MIQTERYTCDYLFAGAGASAALLLLQMEKSGLLAGKKVVLLDPDFSSLPKKTFCFWAKPDEPIVQDCQSLIQKKWGYLRIDRGTDKALKPLQYHYIPGAGMQRLLQDLIFRNNIDCFNCTVSSIKAANHSVCVSTDQGDFTALRIFDSRPAGYKAPEGNEVSVLQSFIGYVIETETPIHQTDCLDMMDFGVDQQGFTQFMYVLPLTNHVALVELTRFGTAIITADDAIPVLIEYVKMHFGEAKILETETGCIPMCSAPLSVSDIDGVTAIGGRAGAVKPGTGYAFKNMYSQAASICRQLKADQIPITSTASARFRFYDRLLLWILCYYPEWGKPIFQQLFKNNKGPGILAFLDQKTTLIGDLGILLSLPFKPFLMALKHELTYRLVALKKPLFLLFVAAALCVLHLVFPTFYNPLQWVLLITGFLWVGLPHGALDHLLESRNISGKISPLFVAKYIGIMAIYFVLWWILPVLSFIIFILYSAFHFGQSDMEEWKVRNQKNMKALLWGVLLLGMLLFPHMKEVAAIAGGMGVVVNTDITLGVFGLLFAAAGIAWGIIGRNIFMVMSTCMLILAMFLPVLSAFGLYFIGQHSLNGWSHLKRGMQASGKTLFFKAFPFTAGAILLMAAALSLPLLGFSPGSEESWISLFFVFLACISMPHVWAMHRFYSVRRH